MAIAGGLKMRKNSGALMGAALAMALVGACSKPASQNSADASTTTTTTADATSNAAGVAGDAASNTVAGAGASGGAVSPPNSPQNDAINPDANKGEKTQTPGSNSFTEGQAKGHIENAGYTDVTALAKTADGLWTGQAKKGGKTMSVSLDFKGAVTSK